MRIQLYLTTQLIILSMKGQWRLMFRAKFPINQSLAITQTDNIDLEDGKTKQ